MRVEWFLTVTKRPSRRSGLDSPFTCSIVYGASLTYMTKLNIYQLFFVNVTGNKFFRCKLLILAVCFIGPLCSATFWQLLEF